jgi:acyl carrier protein
MTSPDPIGRLAAIWAEALLVPHVDPDENFFDLGGHSLLASQIAARVQQAFGVYVPLTVLFDAPTVNELAAVLTTCEPAPADGAAGGPAAGEDVLLEELLGELELLSDDEVEAALADLNTGPGATQ